MSESVRADRPHVSRFGTRETPEREVYLLLQHVAGIQNQQFAVLLRAFGITPEQYHVLRVLGDAGSEGLACSAVADRSVSGDPDVTRLLDRLEKQGWVTRTREATDRRVVTARITDEGRRLLRRLTRPVAALHAGQFEALGKGSTAELRDLLAALTQQPE